jgi:hypothetical protein
MPHVGREHVLRNSGCHNQCWCSTITITSPYEGCPHVVTRVNTRRAATTHETKVPISEPILCSRQPQVKETVINLCLCFSQTRRTKAEFFAWQSRLRRHAVFSALVLKKEELEIKHYTETLQKPTCDTCSLIQFLLKLRRLFVIPAEM